LRQTELDWVDVGAPFHEKLAQLLPAANVFLDLKVVHIYG
jgi:hypothetical protein